MPYWKFLGYNAMGGVIWGVGVVLLGYLAGNSYAAIEKTVGAAAAGVVAVVAIAAFITWRVRRVRDDWHITTTGLTELSGDRRFEFASD